MAGKSNLDYNMNNMSIIALSGYAGSGKDTVGHIIQSFTIPEHRPDPDTGLTSRSILLSPWRIKKFAAKLKEIASLLTGIPVEKFEDQHFKTLPLPKQWDVWCLEINGEKMGCYLSQAEAEVFEEFKRSTFSWGVDTEVKVIKRPMLVREFLQKLGTDACRYGLHPDTWVNALFSEWSDDQQWIITDCRFKNEAIEIKERGGVIVKVSRPILNTEEERHESERDLDDWKFDYVLTNDGSIEELISKTEVMFNEIGYNLTDT